MSNETPTTRSLELAARAWCAPETSGIEMDSRLAMAFAEILDTVTTPIENLPEDVEYALKEVDEMRIDHCEAGMVEPGVSPWKRGDLEWTVDVLAIECVNLRALLAQATEGRG